ncbi:MULTISPECIES: flavin-containing monooxygenase [Mycobacteroides]|uniref:Monooxygenase n=1 Tax=Mycobacteroides chelonae TaxID=1774 RepID=A0AB73LFZ4_MYCCH|nr:MULTISPECIES: NAD(P)/FAD-dependent oxidoreductase [Mycobacteroides]SKL96161.1 Probable monooxygenase [Mycobacteroides abscessus subsp. bolletii]KRQ21994.1 monooxygenase [Mycobacteroides sp. H072]KRQ30879.1 monooxygenase [Mycobacteroides sp. H002]KRQ51578.1 monooxygenase [Mycobacteroides sp. H054]KRQ69750.1 monooxygenase [Mycobacteroides sp. H001]
MKRTVDPALGLHDEPDYEVAIIGAGLGGICAAIKLLEMGIQDFVIIDRDEDFGGTWLRNTYPGVGADIPTVAYQFTFAPKGDWQRFFATGAEIQQYALDLVTEHGLRAHARFGTCVEREVFDEENHLWQVHTADGEVISSRFLISAIGAYINPRTAPDIPGLDTFAGPIQVPSRWQHDVDMRGKRVGIVGVGSSTVQIAPAIAGEVEHLDVYQRTPQWYFPKPDFRMPRILQRLLAGRRFANTVNGIALGGIELGLRVLIYTPKPLFRAGAAIFDKVALWAYRGWLRHKVNDPEVREQLRPRFGAGCTRGTLGADYLPTFNRPNVTLVSNGIDRITPTGIVDKAGVERPVDILVLATGYEMFSDPETYRVGTVLGTQGFDLAEFYRDNGLQAYQSTSVPGLPNRFMLVGPYSWTGTSFHYILENSMRHIGAVIQLARAKRASWVEVTQEALDDFQASIARSGANLNRYFTVNCAGSNSYFINSQGDTPYVRPWTVLQSYRRSVQFPSGAYEFRRINSPVKEIEHAV